jgi:hypothetical protein
MTHTNETTKTIDATVTTAGDMLNGGLRLTFSNGLELSLQLADLTSGIMEQATLHGLKQKLVDAAAISRNPETGRSATVDDKYNAVKEVFDRLLAGQWNKTRGEGTTTAGGLLFRALCVMYTDKPPEAIKAFLDKKTPAEKAALRTNPKIATIIDTLRQPNDDVATDAMLADLE